MQLTSDTQVAPHVIPWMEILEQTEGRADVGYRREIAGTLSEVEGFSEKWSLKIVDSAIDQDILLGTKEDGHLLLNPSGPPR